MPDNFMEKSDSHWLGRLGSSLFGAVIGLLLFIGAFPLEIWNEGRAVAQFKALQEGEKSVISVDAATVNPANQGKLVFISGQAATDEVLTDETFGVRVNGLKLSRHVEMYQWDEDRSTDSHKKIGGGTSTETTYRYHREWSSSLNNSGSFHEQSGHQNPQSMPFSDQQFIAQRARIGAFTLNDEALKEIDGHQSPDLSAMPLKAIDGSKPQIASGKLFIGKNPNMPAVGDVRITYTYTPLGVVSVVGRQVGSTLEPYRASNGRAYELAKFGNYSAQELFKEAEEKNELTTWLIRGGGLLMMWIGICLMGAPLSVAADLLPFLGDVLGAGIGFVGFAVALLLSAVTIGIAWLAWRPLLSAGIIFGALVTVFALMLIQRKRRPAHSG